MWFDGERQPDTIYVANVSRGKDSTAMLRAIRLMGWPLDAVVAVDIWATQDIPAELPPMVEFKEEWDKKCLENFGIPVTRLYATKRERENRNVKMESSTHSEKHTRTTSTGKGEKDNLSEQMLDFQCSETDGARSSKPSKLTYEDIFYRKVSPQRERERMAARTESERKFTDTRISDATGCMVQLRPQKISNYGFPITTKNGGNWCTALKRDAIKSKDFLGGKARGVRTDSNPRSSTTLFY